MGNTTFKTSPIIAYQICIPQLCVTVRASLVRALVHYLHAVLVQKDGMIQRKE